MNFIKTTVVGGVVFLVPIIIFVAVLGEAFKISSRIAKPLANYLPHETIGDLAVVHLVAIAIIVVFCFVAGLVARTMFARRMVDSLETNILSKVPAYALMKTKTQSMLSQEDTEGMKPVVVRMGDSWHIAFEIERVETGMVAIYMPGAPDPWAGSFCVVTNEQVTPLDITLPLAAKLSKRLGKGSNEALRGRVPAQPAAGS